MRFPIPILLEAWVVDFRKGTKKAIHSCDETIFALDLSENGKYLVWAHTDELKRIALYE